MLATASEATKQSKASRAGLAREPTVLAQATEPGVPLFLRERSSLLSNTQARAAPPTPVQRKCAACAAPMGSTPSLEEMTAGPRLQRVCSRCNEGKSESTQRSTRSAFSIGSPHDVFEQEADAVAAQVTRSSAPSPQASVQRTPLFLSQWPRVQAACNACSARAHEEPLDAVQALSNDGPATSDSSFDLESVIAAPGLGAPVPRPVRARVEPILGTDVSQVSVHSDHRAQLAAKSIDARAFTSGDHIFLGSGESPHDLGLMAHELTHTVQQRPRQAGTPARLQRWPSWDDVDSALEGISQAASDAASGVGHAIDRGAQAVADVAAEVDDAAGAALDTVSDAAGDAVDWLATEAGQLARGLASSLGGVVSITSAGLEINIPRLCPLDAIPFDLDLPSSDGELMVPAFAVPLGSLAVIGEVGLVGHLAPRASLQLGPFCLEGVRIVINPLTSRYSIAGAVSAAAAASLGAEARGGLRGALRLVGVIPVGEILIPIDVPVVGVEGGVAGLLRGIGAGRLTIGGALNLSGGVISLEHRDQLELGLAADLFLGAYAQLDVLGQNLCRIYWQPWQWHGDLAGSFGISLGLTVTPGLRPTVAPRVDRPTFDRIPFDQLPVILSRGGFSDDCPIKDKICELLKALHLLPSQNGGTWSWSGPFGPGPRLPGPLEAYLRNPSIPSGALCRGACGPDCNTCAATPARRETDPATSDTWEYTNFQSCPSNDGCREHDAAFDWAAATHGETGSRAIVMPWHMAANIECTCNHLAGDCIAWIAGLPPHDSTMYFADSATCVSTGGGGATTNGPCHDEYPGAPHCPTELPGRDAVLLAWGLPRGVGGFHDCEIVQHGMAACMPSCDGGPGNVWHCEATDFGSGHALTVEIAECVCCNDDDSSAPVWRGPHVLVEDDMSEELILDLCERDAIPRTVCIPLEQDVINRFGGRRDPLDPNRDPDNPPEPNPRPDDAPIVETFNRAYNRLDSWEFFINANHPELRDEFSTIGEPEKWSEWVDTVKRLTTDFKKSFRDLPNTDPAQLRATYRRDVLIVQGEVEKRTQDLAVWFQGRTGSTESIADIIEQVHRQGTELWRAAWRRAILQVNRVLARLWPPAKTRILVWIGIQRSRHPGTDLSGTVGELDYIGSLAGGYKGPPKQRVRFNPRSYDVDANLEAPPLAKFAVAFDGAVPDRQRIFGRTTNITPLKDFSDQAEMELRVRADGYHSGREPFDVAIKAENLPVQDRENTATERLYEFRERLDTPTYNRLLGELRAGGFLEFREGREVVRNNLTESEFDAANAIMDRYPQPPEQASARRRRR